jgi:hypothetical protein
MKTHLSLILAIALFLATCPVFADDSWNVRRVGQIAYSLPSYCISVNISLGNYVYCCTTDSRLRIINIGSPTWPMEAGSYVLPRLVHITSLVIEGEYAYIATDDSTTSEIVDGLRVVNVGNPASVVEIGFFPTSDRISGLAKFGNYLYLANRFDGLRVLDVTNPAHPVEIGCYCPTRLPFYDVAISENGNYAYVAAEDRMEIFDISTNPSSPRIVGTWLGNIGFVDACTVKLSGNYAFISSGSYPKTIDISDPTNPVEIYRYYSNVYVWDYVIDGHYLFMACGDTFRIYDVSNPHYSTLTGYYHRYQGSTCGIATDGNYVYVAEGTFFGVYDCSAATAVGQTPNFAPEKFTLNPAYPNPFNPTTTISFDLPQAEQMTLNIYNVAGQFVRQLVNERLTPGKHTVVFDGSRLPSGMYFYRLNASNFTATRKMLLVK